MASSIPSASITWIRFLGSSALARETLSLGHSHGASSSPVWGQSNRPAKSGQWRSWLHTRAASRKPAFDSGASGGTETLHELAREYRNFAG